MPAEGSCRARRIVCICFFLSGFTSLLYQTIWMRLALAHFGVNSSVVATVLTVFMLGLAVGSFWAGRWTERVESRLRLNGFHLYACAEAFIGIGGWVIPGLFGKSREMLLTMGAAGSLRYSVAGAAFLSLTLLPFCIAMGATFPTALSFLKKTAATDAASPTTESHPFSYLYLANVTGALLGVLLPTLILIEWFGFHATLRGAMVINAGIALLAFFTARRRTPIPAERSDAPPTEKQSEDGFVKTRGAALFLTGFCSMGMEVVWTRIYTPFVGTFVYSFAGILATYLLSTAAGSIYYRWTLKNPESKNLKWPWSHWPWLCLSAVFPILTASVYLPIQGFVRILLGLAPFCGVLGFLTPCLLDGQSGNSPAKAGRAYGLNLLGCVLGPILAGFVLIPRWGNHMTILFLAAPLFLFSFILPTQQPGDRMRRISFSILAVFLWGISMPFERAYSDARVQHDHTATVLVRGGGLNKQLFVNGVSITHMTPITKMMVHFPMAHLDTEAAERNGLVICLGMGTSFRSLVSWGSERKTVHATAVELVPSVAGFLTYFFPDMSGLRQMRTGLGTSQIIVDDGRRFLDRTDQQFDLITVDPPPPVEAAGSSLLYSREFYRSAIRRLKPGGILQMWLPGGDLETHAAVTLALLQSFSHVRVFLSMENWGCHFIASQRELPRLTASELLKRMPASAVRDMTEWADIPAEEYFERMLANEIDPRQLLLDPATGGGTVLTDDRPVNEFFFVRRYLLTRR